MVVAGVRLEMPSNQPVVLLRRAGTETHLPIWIGSVEATAIAFALEGVEPPRPLTHDLIVNLLEAVNNRMVRLEITEMSDGVFYSQMVLADGTTIGSRPSDGIAVALRCGAEIVASEELLAEAGVVISESEATAPDGEAMPEEEVEKFRQFLEDVDPSDFGGGPDTPPTS
ncbi:MAG: bifunctional nuclease family protein [Actinobacteria bacterium]|nr:bifunctional nuclease family protein [Actinomycetota bacterium]